MFRWGIIGSGFAARKFALGLRQSRDSAPVLVYSRTEANARKLAQELKGAKVATSLEEAAQAADVDAFYIATPPTSHRREALACIAAGKAVLIEKPFAHSLEDAEAIVAAARKAGVFCMEGLWTLHLPILRDLRQLLAKGAIGQPRSLAGSFGQSNQVDASDNQFSADLGGGAILHRGLYPLALAINLFGPAQLAATAATIGVTGVDEDCIAVLRHGDGMLSTLRGSLRAPLANDLTIEGTHGAIHVHGPIYRPYRLTLSKVAPARRIRGGGKPIDALRDSAMAQAAEQHLTPIADALRAGFGKSVFSPYGGNGYHYEADEVARCIAEGRTESDVTPLAQTLQIAALIDEARKTWSKPML